MSAENAELPAMEWVRHGAYMSTVQLFLRAPLVEVVGHVAGANCQRCGVVGTGVSGPEQLPGKTVTEEEALDANGLVLFCGACTAPNGFIRRDGKIQQGLCVQ